MNELPYIYADMYCMVVGFFGVFFVFVLGFFLLSQASCFCFAKKSLAMNIINGAAGM